MNDPIKTSPKARHKVLDEITGVFWSLQENQAKRYLPLSPLAWLWRKPEPEVKLVLCDNEKERHKYEEALIAITVEETLKRYCQRIGRPDFWGGESEILFSL
ncbi:unnamed protein product [Lactuca virosa]|uniref:Ubiquitin thioesterase OTU1 n=1 Tax=Lactuca virosa TaxID=75947 RepID=A0AAU9LE76_9ASTR|nr:unnamed protein product [Lactuca virosa]